MWAASALPMSMLLYSVYFRLMLESGNDIEGWTCTSGLRILGALSTGVKRAALANNLIL